MGDVLLHLTPVRDPLAGPGTPPRDAEYRLRLALKALLRCHGWRCKEVLDAEKVDVVVRDEAASSQLPAPLRMRDTSVLDTTATNGKG